MKISRETTFGLMFLLAAALVLTPSGFAQQDERPVNQSTDPMLDEFVFRSIGPATLGGRIDDIEALDDDPFTFYMGLATGGAWKSTNNGTTWTPIFDEYDVGSVGDIAVSQNNHDIVWIGTGEPNNRQSSSFGNGIYKSTDGGASFTHMGLEDTQTIARVVIDPNDDDTVFVAALGHLFGPGEERGVFKTTDGGQTWRKVAYVDDNTGFTDIVIDPSDSDILYAASYQRRRTPWGFNGGGIGSGIWKSTDGGENWTKLSGNGLPEDPVLGRIGLSVYRSDPNVVYAQIEVGVRRPRGGGRGGQRGGAAAGGAPDDPPPPPDTARSGVWRSDDKGDTWQLMSNNNSRPMYYSQIRVDPTNDQVIWTMGSSLYKSVDGGRSFETVTGMGHGDHHALWINPRNGDHVLLGNDGGFNISYDGGATWDFINTMALGQFYAIGVDMRRPYYVYGGLQDNGSWGAPSATRNSTGPINEDWFRVQGSDGFYVRVDPTDHNIVYSESQGGGIRRLNLSTGEQLSIRPRAAGGGGTGSNVQPQPEEGTQYRFNWNTPIEISPHNRDTIYTGANVFFKSVDRGATWVASADLTRQIDRDELDIMGVNGADAMASKNDGQSNYGNITVIGESPIQPGLIWVGTDDGYVQVSRDGGVTFTNVSDRIPGLTAGHKVTRVEPSHHDAATMYLSFDGHMSDDHQPYVFVTRDGGESWQQLSEGLPTGNVRVVREDPVNPNLLFIGTEYALYVSLDGGGEWSRFMSGMPTVRIDDMIIHPRDGDLIVGTHGRSIMIADDITPLQQLTDEVRAAEVHLFDVRPGVLWKNDVANTSRVAGTRHFRGENPAEGTGISYYLRADASDEVAIAITDIEGNVVRELTGPGAAGINRVQWDLRENTPAEPEGGGGGGGGGGGRGGQRRGPLVAAGTYVVTLTLGETAITTTVLVEEDIWMGQ